MKILLKTRLNHLQFMWLKSALFKAINLATSFVWKWYVGGGISKKWPNPSTNPAPFGSDSAKTSFSYACF